MLENILTLKNVKLGVKVTVKSIVSVCLVALAVGLPQIVHLIAGSAGGVTWLPMYLPVLLAGLVLGKWWGLGIGVCSPIVSFLITSAFGNPMPALARLPFMIAELSVFAFVSGVFSNKIMQNKWIAFPAVLLSAVAGRTVFITLVAILQSISPLSVSMVWSQIQTGLIGLVAQALIVPLITMIIAMLLERESSKENKND